MATPTTKKSLEKLRKEGYLCAIVENWNAFAHIRQDLFGFIDILAIKEREILGVQTTSKTNKQSHINKILQHKNFMPVKKSGIKIILHSWGKGKNGKRIIWVCDEQEL